MTVILATPATSATPATKAFDPGDPEFQVLKAGVSKAAANWITKIIAGVGSAGAVWAAVEACLSHALPGLQIAPVASAAGLSGAAAISVTTGDLLYVTGVPYTSSGGPQLRLTTRAAEPAATRDLVRPVRDRRVRHDRVRCRCG